jgi:hypothetical protein
VQVPGDTGFFQVLSGRPVNTSQTGGTMNYVGVLACADCHEDTVNEWVQTPHSHAFETLKAIGQQNNSQCLVCHTVGFGTPLGFKNEAATPHLTGVQCENCHGPAANHVAVTRDASVRPKVTMASEVCGGCHNFHHPTFDEWKLSSHATPVPGPAEDFLEQGAPAMMNCGPCHSGAVRESLLEAYEHGTVPLLPNRIDAAYFGITCAVCHDAHANMDNPPRQPNPMVRNPLYSLANFSYSNSTNLQSFSLQYNPDIQVCGQCHNMRGAAWQNTSRAPHHSPQYNLLIGQGAYDLSQGSPSPHGQLIDTQCSHCHSLSLSSSTGSASAYTSTNYYMGHTTQIDYQACVVCHITTNAAIHAVEVTQQGVTNQIASVKALLDQWATNKAPADLQSKYGTLAWEYSSPGDLSNPNGDSSIKGPTSSEQAQIPDGIKQARFDLYLVTYDGSFGVHNGDYSRYLLNVAKTNVTAALGDP